MHLGASRIAPWLRWVRAAMEWIINGLAASFAA
jgi:hypothetical protein